MGEKVQPIFPEKVAEALNIDKIFTLDAFNEKAIRGALQDVFTKSGLSFLVVRGQCPHIETKHCRVTGALEA